MQDLLAQSSEKDASGNPKLANIGRHLKSVLKENIPHADVKYIDPTYMIRAIATCSQDRIYCKILAHNAVHGAFAGFTGALSHTRPRNTRGRCVQCCENHSRHTRDTDTDRGWTPRRTVCLRFFECQLALRAHVPASAVRRCLARSCVRSAGGLSRRCLRSPLRASVCTVHCALCTVHSPATPPAQLQASRSA